MPSGCFGDSAAATRPRICRMVHSASPHSRKIRGVSIVVAAAAALEDQATSDLEGTLPAKAARLETWSEGIARLTEFCQGVHSIQSASLQHCEKIISLNGFIMYQCDMHVQRVVERCNEGSRGFVERGMTAGLGMVPLSSQLG